MVVPTVGATELASMLVWCERIVDVSHRCHCGFLPDAIARLAFPLFLRAASCARFTYGRNHSTIGCRCQGGSRKQSIENTDGVAAADLSCSAKAEHPVNTVAAVITGSSACADDDRIVLSPPPLHPPRQIIEIDLELLGLADFVLELGDIVGRELRRRLAGGFDHELNLRGVFQHDR